MPKSLYNEFLNTFTRIQHLPPDKALLRILSLIAKDVNGTKALCTVYRREENSVTAINPSLGIERDELINLFRFSLERKSALVKAIEDKNIYYTNDALNDPFFIKEFILSFEVTRVMIIPVFDANGEFLAAIYVDGKKDFGEREVKKARNWMKILYPLLSYILKLKAIKTDYSSYAEMVQSITSVVAEINPENALSVLTKNITKSNGICSIVINLKRGDEIPSTITQENNNTLEDCIDPALKKTIVRETPLSHTESIEIKVTYNKLSLVSRNINLLLNTLSFLTSYVLRNRDKNDLFMKISLIRSLSDALYKVKNEKELAETVTKMLFEFGHYEDVAYLKHIKNHRKLQLLSQFTIVGMNLYTTYEQPVDVGILGKAAKEKKTVVVNDTANNQDYYAGFPERRIFQSEAAIPLLYEGETVAILNIETTRKNSFNEQELMFLDAIKYIIENKLALILYENEVTKDRERMEVLNKLIDELSPHDDYDTIIKKSLDILQHIFGEIFIFYMASYNNGIIVLKRNDGPVIELHKKDQPKEMLDAFINKVSVSLNFGGYFSFLVPFRECHERVGIFVQKRTGEFTEATRQFLTFAANFMCKLIHNSNLYREVDLRLKEIGFLYNFSREITEAKDREELFEKTYALVKKLFKVEDFYIALYSEKEDTIYLEMDYDGNVKQRKRIIPLQKSQGLTAWIIKQRRPVIINDWEKEAISYPIIPLGNKPHNSYIGIPLTAENRVLGVIALQSPEKNHFSGHTLSLLSTIATQLSITLSNMDNVKKMQGLIDRLENTYDETLEALSHALDYREEETEYHSKRVASYALLVAKAYKLTDENKLKYIYWGGLLHDIGKIGIPDKILLKPGKLNEEEWQVMKKHVIIGYQILKGINFLKPALPLVLHHHEWWNGKGYPMGLKGEEIPLEARIFSVVDAFDAMTSDRPYRKAMSYKKAVDELKRMSGVQFDPKMVETFIQLPFEELIKINPGVRKE